MTTQLPPAARLLELIAETQELLPEHTHKAFMWHVDRLPSIEEKCQKLEAGIKEFRRGLPG